MKAIQLLAILFGIIACTLTGNDTVAQSSKTHLAQSKQLEAPIVLIYKTRKDYSNQVPVILSDDGTSIEFYPDPKDFGNGKVSPVPIKLKKGYLLDNRGIGLNVVYLKWTYAEYAALHKAPSKKEMMAKIIDKKPLTALVNCGNRYLYKNLIEDLNKLILANKLKQCCKVIL